MLIDFKQLFSAILSINYLKMAVFTRLQNIKLAHFATPLLLSAGVLLCIGISLGFYYEDNQVVLVNLLYYAKPNEL